ncbi:MAG TPA: hypothetical protein VFG07_07355 [Thermoplasmata archaeon]|nr:hypothetical protein [Thermoplasmata archaeon]
MLRQGKKDLKKLLSRFSRTALVEILDHLGIDAKAPTRAAILDSLVRKQSETALRIVRTYQRLTGVSLNLAVDQLYLHDPSLGPVVRDSKNKPDLVRRLFLSDRTEALESIASFVKFARKKNVSPLTFEGNAVRELDQKGVERLIQRAIDRINPGRPRPILLDRVEVAAEVGRVKVALWREGGKRHVRQHPARVGRGAAVEHDDYPLRPHVIEVSLKEGRIRTTFRSTDRDGEGVLRAVTESFITYSAPPARSRFLSNPFDADEAEELKRRIGALRRSLRVDDSRIALLDALTTAKKNLIAFNSLQTEGNLKKLEVRADDADKALRALGARVDLLQTAKSHDYELRFDDGRTIRVSPWRVGLTGIFTPAERESVELIFSE